MAKRGRPRHPDILTPREWEVLALLREGLTNEQIAQRLDITERTAKFHVSEILSKLGVSSRDEAARWQPEEHRPWWQAAFAPLALAWKKVTAGGLATALAGGIAIVVVVGVGVLVWGLLRTDETARGATGSVDPSLSVDEVYENVRAAVSREGQVLHATRQWDVDFRFGAESQQLDYQDEVWLDAASDIVRRSTDGVGGDFIVIGSIAYGGEPGGGRSPAQDCHGHFEPSISALLGCVGLDDSNTEVRTGADWDGIPAIALVTDGTSDVDGCILDVTQIVYVDAVTYLPLATDMTSSTDDCGGRDQHLLGTFTNEFVPADSLPDDFFALSSIGAEEIDFSEGLGGDPGIDVYWLGEEFAAQGAMPGLQLQVAHVTTALDTPPPEPYQEVTMTYDDLRQFARNLVTVNSWHPVEWDQYEAQLKTAITIEGVWWDETCAQSTQIDLPQGMATIYSRVQPQPVSEEQMLTPGPCLPGEPDQFRAHVLVGETLVTIDPITIEENPYNSMQGITQLATGLVLYVPS
jgi:DNA-binding CsgD family transcriptional regulator